LKVGIPQVLACMMAAPQRSQPIYGMVTNGSSFTFLKLAIGDNPQYAQSDVFDIERSNDLAMVLAILKQLGQSMIRYSSFP
jgi:hypothetical protein